METKLLRVDETTNNIRIDKYLVMQLSLSRTHIQKLIDEGNVLVNGEATTSSYKVKINDEVQVEIPDPKAIDAKPEKMDLDIIYEDDDIIVINKPKGLVCHPSVGNEEHTLVNGLLYHCKDLSGINGNIRPGIVHRIDKDTTGCLVVCKNDKAHENIAKQIQNKTCHREYLALVEGEIPHNTGTIDAPIGRDNKDRQKMAVTDVNSKEAQTDFEVVERFAHYTLVRCVLRTGRTHQIRVHMQYIGFPVVNDPKYNKHKSNFESINQVLHAYKLELIHPTTNQKMVFEAPLPDYFEKILEQLRGGNIDTTK